MKKTQLHILLSVWTILIIISFVWNINLILSNNEKVVLNKSKSFFNQILIARAWNASHEGIYAPISSNSPPNPYLTDSLRDLTSNEGIKLTKINPSYMTRQMAELNENKTGLKFHITSLNPIRPQNASDKWESEALYQFEKGLPEKLDHIITDSLNIYRYMAPLMVTNACMKCHEQQGYKIGDIRGGISISFDANLYLTGLKKHLASISGIHFLLLLLGVIGLYYNFKQSGKYFSIISNKNEELTKVNATKDKIFKIIVHDLKNPFISILGYTSILKNEQESLSNQEKIEFINVIENASQGSYQLLENLQHWAIAQQNRITLTKTKLYLKKLTEEAIKIHLPAMELKKIKINMDIADNLYFIADFFTLKIVIANLFSNAIKFTPEKGLITINAKEINSQVTFYVSDTGVGIPENIANSLFDLNTNYTTRGTQNEKGTGLGLLICKDFIEKHNGKIWVTSKPQVGSTFGFSIPN